MNAKRLVPLALAAAACGASADEKLNIRTGTWEITATTEMSGIPLPRDMLDQMTPEQRAQVESALKSEAARGPRTEVTRECITQEDLERPFNPSDAEGCRQTIVRTTRTTQEARLECTGEQKGSGLLRVSAPNPETMTATLDMRAGEGPEAFTIKAQMKGRWLSVQCEDEDAEEPEEEDLSAPDEYDEPEDEQ